MGDPAISFAINCSNSLNFAELYLESSVCYDDDCLSVSIVDDSVNNTSVSTDPPPTTMPTVPVPDMYVCGLNDIIFAWVAFVDFYNRPFQLPKLIQKCYSINI